MAERVTSAKIGPTGPVVLLQSLLLLLLLLPLDYAYTTAQRTVD